VAKATTYKDYCVLTQTLPVAPSTSTAKAEETPSRSLARIANRDIGVPRARYLRASKRYKCNDIGAFCRNFLVQPRVAVPRKADLLFFPVGADAEKGFAVFYRVTVFHEDTDYFAGCIGFDFVH
jgi:hypothetical protein